MRKHPKVGLTLGLLSLVGISACTTETSEGAGSDRETAAANTESVSDTSSVSPISTASETIYIQTFPDAHYPTPDTTMRGRFEARNGCLVFVSGNDVLRAVLPAGTALSDADTIALAGVSVPLNEEVVVKGGEGEFGQASTVRENCPRRAVLIGGLE